MLIALFTPTLAKAQDKPKTVWDGAYTTAQAARGQAHSANCAACHQADLGGKGCLPLKGDGFMERWHDYSVPPFKTYIGLNSASLRFRMPDTRPLPDERDLYIITYLFKTNGFPPARSELATGNLDVVQILERTAFSLHQSSGLATSVGCLKYKPISWMLSYAMESPVRRPCWMLCCRRDRGGKNMPPHVLDSGDTGLRISDLGRYFN